jgi:hypothetical protein
MRTIKRCLVHEGLAGCCFGAALLFASGCSETEAGRVPLEDVSALLVAQSDGMDTLVYGMFANEGPSTARHYPVERVSGSLGSETIAVPFDQNSPGFSLFFFGKSEGTVKLTFTGRDLDQDIEAQLKLPASFTPVLEQPQVARDQMLVAELGAPGASDELTYNVGGDCVQGTSETIADVAQLQLGHSRLVEPRGQEHQTCEVTLFISRATKSVLDTDFGKGTQTIAEQNRHTTFESLPPAVTASE